MNAILMLSRCAKHQGGEDLDHERLRLLGYVVSPVHSDDAHRPSDNVSIGATDAGLEGAVPVQWGADEGIAW